VRFFLLVLLFGSFQLHSQTTKTFEYSKKDIGEVRIDVFVEMNGQRYLLKEMNNTIVPQKMDQKILLIIKYSQLEFKDKKKKHNNDFKLNIDQPSNMGPFIFSHMNGALELFNRSKNKDASVTELVFQMQPNSEVADQREVVTSFRVETLDPQFVLPNQMTEYYKFLVNIMPNEGIAELRDTYAGMKEEYANIMAETNLPTRVNLLELFVQKYRGSNSDMYKEAKAMIAKIKEGGKKTKSSKKNPKTEFKTIQNLIANGLYSKALSACESYLSEPFCLNASKCPYKEDIYKILIVYEDNEKEKMKFINLYEKQFPRGHHIGLVRQERNKLLAAENEKLNKGGRSSSSSSGSSYSGGSRSSEPIEVVQEELLSEQDNRILNYRYDRISQSIYLTAFGSDMKKLVLRKQGSINKQRYRITSSGSSVTNLSELSLEAGIYEWYVETEDQITIFSPQSQDYIRISEASGEKSQLIGGQAKIFLVLLIGAGIYFGYNKFLKI